MLTKKPKGQISFDGIIAAFAAILVFGVFIIMWLPIAENLVIPIIQNNLPSESQPDAIVLMIRIIPVLIMALILVSILRSGATRESAGFQ